MWYSNNAEIVSNCYVDYFVFLCFHYVSVIFVSCPSQQLRIESVSTKSLCRKAANKCPNTNFLFSCSNLSKTCKLRLNSSNL